MSEKLLIISCNLTVIVNLIAENGDSTAFVTKDSIKIVEGDIVIKLKEQLSYRIELSNILGKVVEL